MSERVIRKKAKEIGYSIHKGVVHYLCGGVHPYREVGYNVEDDTTGFMIWGCYNEVFDHQFTLEDCEDFIKSEYERLGLDY